MQEDQTNERYHSLIRWIYLRGLGAIYFIAFASLLPQIRGLIGELGISPANGFLRAVTQAYSSPDCFLKVPSIFWLGASDNVLVAATICGCIASLLCVSGFFAAPAFIACWVLYLSIVSVGQQFLGFQWDSLLLEAGFLAIFMAPWALRDTRTTPARPRTILFMWMTRLLLFKLMFLSGIVKIASGDPTWRDATALGYHYETQPLPTPLAWYVNQMPPWFDALSTYLMFVVELIVPLFMFGGLRARIFAAIATVGLQIIILSTGNYTFFNLLTMLLCVSLVDNSRLPRFQRGLKGYPWGPAIVAISIFIISVESVVDEFTGGMAISAPANQILSLVGPFRAVNNYGLFRVMTTTRDEITIEGSYDGVNWKPYVFPFKPGPLDRAPPMVAPHQPRLDWQMWFASLGTVRNNMWFLGLAQRLLEGSPPVLELLASNPFPDKPPTYIRATIAPYHFTNFDEFGRTKHWWKAGDASVYLPPARL